ncbi:class I SAM-dependent methyltransferase [Pirellulales bacterium]|nr:class I SAM-dependent methyltransferase [Pirellulales bacterium]
MSLSTAANYEELPYTNNAVVASYPLTLATVATLHGFQAPDPHRSRVLELGCGRGGNLLPMAESLPESRFVGIDQSPRQIEEACDGRETLGMQNVDFHVQDFLDVGQQYGAFDYILGHGVYSWVAPNVQEAILRLCGARLAADGIAYLSYNTLPGWHYRGVLRDMLRYHADSDASAAAQIEQARSLFEWVARDIPDRNGLRSQLIVEECGLLARQADGYIYHDQLEPENHPCYFHEFAAQAAAHGLQYIAEAQAQPLLTDIPSTAHLAVREAAKNDRVRYEQYLDFLVHRTFRRTLLCRAGPDVFPKPQAEQLRRCHFKGIASPTKVGADFASSDPLTFHTTEDVRFTSEHPAVKTTLVTLHEMGPLAVPFEALAERTAPRLGFDSPGTFQPLLVDLLLACYHRDVVRVYGTAPVFFPQVSERPVASPVARLQAGGDSRVTNREHRSIGLGEFDRFVLRHMDGTRNRDAILAALCEGARSGKLKLKTDLADLAHDAKLIAALGRSFDDRAEYLAGSGFLIG